MSSYIDTIRYLEGFIDYEKISAQYDVRDWKLERVERLLEMLENPHLDMRIIHVAGTKGKGSTCAMIASILKEANFKVGLYTSPHLVDFRERIKINGQMISEGQLVELVNMLKPKIKELETQEDRYGRLSFFDVYTVLALLFFHQQEVDFAVIEVGLGGRLDATNVVKPLVSVITQISYDHMHILGNTLESIAAEKAGIIKEGTIVVSSPQYQPAMSVIESVCLQKNVKLILVGRDINFVRHGGKGYEMFDILGLLDNYKNLKIYILGEHQVINATTAVGAIEALRSIGMEIHKEAIASGLERASCQGRIEVIRQKPLVILDVAHNEASTEALIKTIKSHFTYKRSIFILGMSMFKDVRGIGKHICHIADKIILTKGNNPRSMNPSDIRDQLKDFREDFILTDDVATAVREAFAIADLDDLICITGSFYVASDALQAVSAHET